VLVAAIVERMMHALLFGVDPGQPSTYAGALAGLTIAAVLASWLPARRAMRISPLQAIREQ
jgi:ABC-type lipoprotein release transport system permease subunit